ncbi:MAG: DEAD/DEAH box helicase [Patescibacteria group bacterium]
MKGGNIHEFIRRANVKNTSISPTQVADEVLFSSLDLPETLKATIVRHGYINLTPIQAQGIPAIRSGKDVIGIANTGTGKTAAFLIPLVENILKDFNYKALIISPTRELALQTRDELRKFSGNMPIFSTLCIGQSSMQMQVSQLRHNPHVVVGTPGRLKDLINRGVLKLGMFKMIILDETDQMLDMGFIHDIKEIISYLPADRQSLFFSATVSPAISMLINSFVKNPVTISVKTQETLTNIKQDLVRLDKKIGSKMEKLSSLLRQEEFKKVLVFGRTKHGVERMARDLFQKGFKVTSIHGDKAQFQRQQAIRMFKEDVVKIMVATDVAARGLDIANVSHVINYDIPQTYEDYIHRIGRTGRANLSGTALTFVEE